MNPVIYNYTNIINHFKTNNGNKFLDKLYTTNNICESINSKFDYYLPKKQTNNFLFVKSVTKVLLNELHRDKYINRKDCKTKALIKLKMKKI